jgi:SH3-like domain-containing protein
MGFFTVAKGVGRGRFGSAVLAALLLLVAAGTAWSLLGNRTDSQASANTTGGGQALTTGSIEAGQKRYGPSGLPLPRFVSLKAEKVNVRRGPSSDHAVAWVFQRKGLPVEIVAESENWRRIRDSDGEEGWILQNMLSGKRTAVIAPWRSGRTMPLYSEPGGSGLIARLSAGVVGEIGVCNGDWCEIAVGGYEGWVEQTMLWGVYPGESFD